MSVYNIAHKIGDEVFWVHKKLVSWNLTRHTCPECAKYGCYEHITHDVFIDGSRRKCIRGILYKPNYRYEIKTYKICSVAVRTSKSGDDIVYYTDENGVNHYASNTFATRDGAYNELCRIYGYPNN